jgi:aspartyl-tRNA(Asn)/glutamyl-tRNA(Gln) amidotransferase subunit A
LPRLTTIASAADQLRRGVSTAADLVEQCLAAVDSHGADTNAFIQLDAAAARAAARHADAERRRGVDRGLLHGVPISIKDLIDVEGLPTTCASRAMPATPAVSDAPIVTRLREAGAVLFGKTNLHEFALGTTSDESAWGPVRHPVDASRSAGGSSGGSAVAVATGMGLASVGTDTGGSIRIPASVCGVVGLKPTFGDIPLEGVVPLSVTLDHAGPLAQTVADAGCLWEVLAARPGDTRVSCEPRELRLGQLGGPFESEVQPEVHAAFERALETLRAAGVSVSTVPLAGLESIADAYVNLALPEAAAWHDAHIHGERSLYSPGVAARLDRGRAVGAVQYLAAQERRKRFSEAVSRALTAVHALVTPTLPMTAPPLLADEIEITPGESGTVSIRSAMLRCTQPFNMSRHPAISIPLPVPGLPVGLQLVGAMEGTPALLAVAAACERVLGVR